MYLVIYYVLFYLIFYFLFYFSNVKVWDYFPVNKKTHLFLTKNVAPGIICDNDALSQKYRGVLSLPFHSV